VGRAEKEGDAREAKEARDAEKQKSVYRYRFTKYKSIRLDEAPMAPVNQGEARASGPRRDSKVTSSCCRSLLPSAGPAGTVHD
jgi:hypothetical protein